MRPGYLFGDYWFGFANSKPAGKNARRTIIAPAPPSQIVPKAKALPLPVKTIPTAKPTVIPKAAAASLGPPSPQVKKCMDNIERLIAIGMVTRARVPNVRAQCEGKSSAVRYAGPLKQYGR